MSQETYLGAVAGCLRFILARRLVRIAIWMLPASRFREQLHSTVTDWQAAVEREYAKLKDY